jgi:cell division protein FtsW
MKLNFVTKKQKKSQQVLSLFSIKALFRGGGPDQGLLFSVMGLLVFGWVMVYSSSALFAESHYHDQFFFLKRQVIWSLIGLAFFFLAANIPLSWVQKHSKKLYIFTVFSLLAVLVVGRQIAGAKRWLHFGPMNFQPSELAKLAMVLTVADYMDRRQSRLASFKKGLFPIFALVGILLTSIVVEPDLGTPSLMGSVFVFLLILGGAQWKHLFLMVASAIPLIVFAIIKVRYRMLRLLAYLNPWSDAQGTGYQLVQSLLALGSGGIFGRGLGGSRIKISSLPDAHTDFVFSVLGEELGLVGTLLSTGLFLYLCFRGLKIASQAPTFFSRLVAAGISLTVGFQAVINMGVASGLFPTKGMPLPFVSFGGSSLVITLIGVGLLANISKFARPNKELE